MFTRLRQLRLTRWGVAAPVVFAMAGLLATTSAATARGTDLRAEGRTNTADLVREQEHRAQVQENQVAQLRAQVQELSRAGAPSGSQLESLTKQVVALGQAAGTRPVRGRALRVSLDDAPHSDQVPDGFEPDDLVVHQQDVQAVVNTLWAAGAEAMMLMDQRVISTSAVRCVGNVLILQDRVYSPPYKITAIGDPAKMERALEDSEQLQIYRQYVDAVGLGYKVERLGLTKLPGYDGSLLLEHATAIR
ncbi:DUF881 domain-containing protein [Angustibacter luteus]|uniref:DUF881 domain-containing protein n=1 Tax=Angustibacter luteus TaxID=658456 RepID=A0ABW1JF74_9ACTN